MILTKEYYNKKRLKEINNIYTKFIIILIFSITIFELLTASFVQNSVQNMQIIQGSDTKSLFIKNTLVTINIMPIVLPSNLAERANIIQESFESLGYTGVDLDRWMKIAKKESGGSYDPRIEPPTWVIHCKTGSTYYAVELNANRRQAFCRVNDVEVYREKSKGIIQILPSTWKRNNCKDFGSNDDWFAQIQCGDRILKRSGWSQWTTN